MGKKVRFWEPSIYYLFSPLKFSKCGPADCFEKHARMMEFYYVIGKIKHKNSEIFLQQTQFHWTFSPLLSSEINRDILGSSASNLFKTFACLSNSSICPTVSHIYKQHLYTAANSYTISSVYLHFYADRPVNVRLVRAVCSFLFKIPQIATVLTFLHADKLIYVLFIKFSAHNSGIKKTNPIPLSA